MKLTLKALRQNAVIKRGGIRGVDWQESVSPYGYNLAEVISAVIKEIRRGKPEEAYYWALQMALSGREAEKFLWECISVCSIEDVGLANPDALLQVHCSKELYFSLPIRKEDGRRFSVLAYVVTYLSQSPKTRFTNELCGAVIQKLERGEMKLEIPDYALDMHVKKGRELGRKFKHYLTEAAVLSKEDKTFPSEHREYLLGIAEKQEEQ